MLRATRRGNERSTADVLSSLIVAVLLAFGMGVCAGILIERLLQ
jgi:hypothetical protein